MSLIHMSNTDITSDERDKVQNDVDIWLAKGNKIEEVEMGRSGFIPHESRTTRAQRMRKT